MYLVPGGVSGPEGGVPGPGGCTWSQGGAPGPGWWCTWSWGCTWSRGRGYLQRTPPVNRMDQTGVKIQTCPKLRLRAVKIQHSQAKAKFF